MSEWWWAAVPVLCLLIDLRLGEPPARWHPVVWIGHYLQWAGDRVAPRQEPRSPRPVAVPAQGQPAPGVRPDGSPAAAPDASPDPGASIGTGIPASTAAASGNRAGQGRDASHAVPPPSAAAWRPFLAGSLAWLAGALVVWCLANALQSLCLSMPALLALPLMALCLKPLMAWAMLRDEALAVEAALQQSLPAGRERLGWLVSRDTRALAETDVREATIETVAENLNDSVVAPLFWFVLLGLPGAALYRFANTADAMWGYPGERGGRNWQWAGKWAARVDDLLGWLPARLTALLLMMGARWPQWRRLPAEARRTPSPNGGWPMAAMALRLDCRLGKPGAYCLNPSAAAPDAGRLSIALRRAGRTAWWTAVLCVLVMAFSGLA